MPETRARDLANLAGAGATSSTVAYHETARSITLPAGTGASNQVISSDGDGTTIWADVALTPNITELTWYSDSGYSSTLTSAEAINLDDATYLKVTGVNLGSSSAFQTSAYVQIINTTQSNAVVGHNQSSLNGCVTAATYVSETEVRFTINPNGISGINAGDTLKVKFITAGGDSLFATGYAVSADPTSVTTVNSATVNNTDSVGTVGGQIAGGSQDYNTELLLNFDRADASTDLEDSSNIGGKGSKVTVHNGGNISNTAYKITGKSNNTSLGLYGSSDHVKVSNNIVPAFMSETSPHNFTVDAWIYPTSSPGDTVIWGHHAHNGHSFGLGFHVTSDVSNYYGGFRACAFSWSNTGDGTGTGSKDVDGKGADTVALSNNTWYHCLWHVYWPTEQPVCDFFLDGVYKGRTTHSTASASHRTISNFTDTAGTTDMFAAVGAKVDYQGTDTLHFQGHIDRLRVRSGDTTKVSEDPLYFATAFASRVKGTTYFTPTSTLYGEYRSDTINTVTLTGSAGVGGGHVTFNNATLSGNTETTSALPAGLTLSPRPYTGGVATITGDLTAGVGTHAINLVARVTSDGTDANVDPNRKQDYSHTIEKASGGAPTLFNARRYKGDGENTRSIEGFGFAPDLLWSKNRDNSADWHGSYDTLRGAGHQIASNSGSANDTTANPATINSFDSDGFTFNGQNRINEDGKGIIVWGWKAGGTPSGDGKRKRSNSATEDTLSSGTDYSTSISAMRQSVNVEGDFSITKYTGNSDTDNGWFKHGLSGTPDFVIIKNLDSAHNWICYHTGLGASTGNTSYIQLNQDQRQGYYGTSFNSQTLWTSTGITNDKINLDGAAGLDWVMDDESYICYAWKAVAGVSAFGSFSGNGFASSTPYDLVLGFHPKLIILKRANADGNWHMYDSFRSNRATNTGDSNNGGHSMQPPLMANSTDTEDSHQTTYFGATNSDSVTWYTSGNNKGVRINTNNGEINGSGDTILYMAWA